MFKKNTIELEIYHGKGTLFEGIEVVNNFIHLKLTVQELLETTKERIKNIFAKYMKKSRGYLIIQVSKKGIPLLCQIFNLDYPFNIYFLKIRFNFTKDAYVALNSSIIQTFLSFKCLEIEVNFLQEPKHIEKIVFSKISKLFKDEITRTEVKLDFAIAGETICIVQRSVNCSFFTICNKHTFQICNEILSEKDIVYLKSYDFRLLKTADMMTNSNQLLKIFLNREESIKYLNQLLKTFLFWRSNIVLNLRVDIDVVDEYLLSVLLLKWNHTILNSYSVPRVNHFMSKLICYRYPIYNPKEPRIFVSENDEFDEYLDLGSHTKWFMRP